MGQGLSRPRAEDLAAWEVLWNRPGDWRAWQAWSGPWDERAGAPGMSREGRTALASSSLDLPLREPAWRALAPGRAGWPWAPGAGGPPILYLEGSEPNGRIVGVVGTRRADSWALSSARRLAEGLARRGCGTVSGLAAGVDRAAHEGSLAGGAPSWAVFGTGLGRTYPASHAGLRRELVAGGGGVLSEFPARVTGHPGNFPRRNRVVAALAEVLVVVQAPARSGTLHTVRAALDLGRDVFVVPGPLDEPGWEGSAALLAEGAPPCLGISALAEALALPPAPAADPADPLVARLAEKGPRTPEELGPEGTLARLGELELAGSVRLRPDGSWEAVT